MKNKDNYNRLKYNPTETHNRLVKDNIERFKKQKMIKEKIKNKEYLIQKLNKIEKIPKDMSHVIYVSH